VHAVFDESQVFRIDHFLGKESVDNILAFRFANGLFEPVWNRHHSAYVQIDVPETLSIEGRGDFYDHTGAYRDMIVTHLFQVLGFVAMEPPTSFDARHLRDEAAKVFDALKPINFRRPPLRMFPIDRDRALPGRRNEIVIDFADPGSITARFLAKEPGAQMMLQTRRNDLPLRRFLWYRQQPRGIRAASDGRHER
jgi:glucose-6-phosphate 1-dehydrogenase